MPVIESTIVEDSPQADGRRAVRELHRWEDGREEFADYLAEKDTDAQTDMESRAKAMNEAEADRIANPQPNPEEMIPLSKVAAIYKEHAKVDDAAVKQFTDLLVAAVADASPLSDEVK